jgi:hypothetical protein
LLFLQLRFISWWRLYFLQGHPIYVRGRIESVYCHVVFRDIHDFWRLLGATTSAYHV